VADGRSSLDRKRHSVLVWSHGATDLRRRGDARHLAGSATECDRPLPFPPGRPATCCLPHRDQQRARRADTHAVGCSDGGLESPSPREERRRAARHMAGLDRLAGGVPGRRATGGQLRGLVRRSRGLQASAHHESAARRPGGANSRPRHAEPELPVQLVWRSPLPLQHSVATTLIKGQEVDGTR
jgi:hypothetical protein